MILGIIYHSSLIYSESHDWRVNYYIGDGIFDLFVEFVHSFRMGSFFIISGFFLALLIDRKGVIETIRNRFLKLLIPMIFVGFTFNTGMNIMSQLDGNAYTFDLKYIFYGKWLGHLWFIGNLFVYCVFLAYPTRMWLNHRSCERSPVIVLLLMLVLVPTTSCFLMYAGDGLYMGNLFFISFKRFYEFLPYFMCGIFMYGNKISFFEFMGRKHAILTLAAICVVLSQLDHDYFKAYYSFSLSLLVLLVLNYIGGMYNPLFISKTSNASYTMYLVHQPIIVFLFFIFGSFQVGIFYSFLFVSLSTLLLSYIFHLLVKRSRIALFLFNGIISKQDKTMRLVEERR